ncbi:LacI family DNA-binding transcriptional regulator [Thermohalobacter berrensis]|uniref:Alanine racemase n=1 Tax=Thermohalobacter berrensis TaxID=99594 RepID=A0A419T5D6_9FIRM|nr:LacI family DNA-binding transcriptional regulator [Thermohalobacter berrensis]RKD32740.1 alanine racemase [Thermohalobacter berrensis]
MNKNRNVTIKDVAKKAGVSVSTVSRAFNGYSDINKETRERIFKIAEEIGYVPSILARGMRAEKANRIGIAIEDYDENEPTYSFTYRILVGFMEYASERGYEVVFLPNLSKYQESRLVQILKDYHLDGVFLVGLKLSDEFYKQALRGEFPCVLFDIPIKRGKIGFVGTDSIKGASLAIEHFVKNGHKKIAFINGHENAYVSLQRLDGYYLSLMKNDITIDKTLIYFGDFTEESGKEGVRELFNRHRDISAIFAASDLMAIGAIKELKKMGKRIPDDVEIIGFDDLDLSAYITPKLSTIRQNSYKIGVSAATLLINLINGQNINQIILEPELVLRQSTKN